MSERFPIIRHFLNLSFQRKQSHGTVQIPFNRKHSIVNLVQMFGLWCGRILLAIVTIWELRSKNFSCAICEAEAPCFVYTALCPSSSLTLPAPKIRGGVSQVRRSYSGRGPSGSRSRPSFHLSSLTGDFGLGFDFLSVLTLSSFCLYNALRQRRDAIATITTPGCNICRADVWERNTSSSTKNTHITKNTFNELNVFQLARTITIPASHHNPLHSVAAHPCWEKATTRCISFFFHCGFGFWYFESFLSRDGLMYQAVVKTSCLPFVDNVIHVCPLHFFTCSFVFLNLTALCWHQ